MKTQSTTTEARIVAFHIGRGGYWNNPGHLTFIGENTIGHYVDDLFLNYENAWIIGKKIRGYDNLEQLLRDAIDGDKSAAARLEKWGLSLGQYGYADCNGTLLITEEEVETGIGCIDSDGDYDTTYTCLLSDCNEKELQSILNYIGYVDSDIIEYAKQELGVEETEED